MAGCIDDYRQHSELTNFCEKKLWHFAMTINKIENRKLLYSRGISDNSKFNYFLVLPFTPLLTPYIYIYIYIYNLNIYIVIYNFYFEKYLKFR